MRRVETCICACAQLVKKDSDSSALDLTESSQCLCLLDTESPFTVHGVMVWVSCEDSAGIHSYELHCMNTDVSYHTLLVLFYLLLLGIIQLYQLNLETSDRDF